MNICCVQEIKQKGEKSKEICEWYKIIYSDSTNASDSVGVILNVDVKGNVIKMIRNINIVYNSTIV